MHRETGTGSGERRGEPRSGKSGGAGNEVAALFAALTDRFQRLDVLVNNAGIQRDVGILDMTLDDWNRVIGVNLTGQFLCAREAARLFVGQGHDERISRSRGRIVCISSVHEAIPWACHVNYAQLLELIPYGRVGDPEDVAAAVCWLASDRSDYVHGETLFVDGGMMLYPAFRGGG